MFSGKNIMKPDGFRLRLAGCIATMGPIGLVPKGPGTLAAFITLIPTYFLAAGNHVHALAILTVIIITVGQWASYHAEQLWGSDPSCVVIDEAAGQLIAVIFLPADLMLFTSAFVLFRIFDIWKPWPVSWIDNRSFSWSVMGDDVAAGMLSRLVLFLFQFGISL